MLHIDPESWVPPFEQLRTQISDQIRSAELPAGHRLPPVRRLAADLGLAANTVARAYRELEQAGIAEGRGTRGTFVVGPPSDDDELRAAAVQYARRAAEIGATPEGALDVVRAALTQGVPGSA
ncbi:GntR family transcriptional regulator [Actinomycetospora endophytica]|uniref:GntR family transcriptional regulator n=1 Tax=Actinomycetospora endophytica TaxID=2291215 RepID=A0ABS8PF47_9PSEU|nr:GntR family transcriptional regulator [Actinomycetospora endophytica]MCD2196892.1 GntR family transcriptional regulator [Actinomycetospora endophytica]